MEKQGAKTVVPKLRFPEFRASAEWEVHELQSIAHLAKGVQLSSSLKDDAAKFPHFNGGVTYSSRTGRANRDANTTIISEGGNSCGYVQFVDEPFWCGGHCYSIVPKRPDQNRYLFYVLQARQKEIMGLRVGSGLPNIPKNVLEKFEVAFAKDSFEQQKIADCLTSLDEVIAAQGRKIEALKAHKRGLMQQLFPREGETRPRLRFPEFRDAPEWEERPLGELVDLLSGYPFDGSDIVEDSSGERLMRGINITEGVIRHNAEIDRYYLGSTEGIDKFRLEKNDLVIGMDGSKVGKNSALISEEDAGALLIQRVARLRANSEFLINFIFHQVHSPRFHAYVDRINTSSGIPHISANQIKEYPIYFTGEQEQKRIADCLTSLDAQITAESNQLATLKTHKQGLMQQLFPTQEA